VAPRALRVEMADVSDGEGGRAVAGADGVDRGGFPGARP